LRPVHIKGIALENFKSRLTAPTLAKVVGQRLVEFDSAHAIRARKQVCGQCPAAGTDLDSQSGVLGARSGSNSLQNPVADEKVLSEFLTRQFCGSSCPD
jgi:hypothetical protein